ncbi:MAG: RNA polymerase sigma factor RpoE [Gammaproteobacteria bacterium]|nr:MAG: RNA polymerase sigma factor RpoE [Gammaproteobacteria bacterium]
MQDFDDKKLIRLVQKGQKEAFDILVIKYQNRVANLIGSIVKNNDIVPDLTQETFIKAYRGLTNFKGDSTFYTWIYRIAINTTKSYFINNKNKVLHNAIKKNSNVDAENDYNFEKELVEYETPDKHLKLNLIKKMIGKTINNMPDDLKIAISLREFDGLSYDEIAKIMLCPLGTVRSRIFRARETITDKLKTIL